MRLSVLLCDAAVFITGALAWVRARSQSNEPPVSRLRLSLALLLCPPLLLIDHGHFQYNCVALGLFIWAATFAIQRKCVLLIIDLCMLHPIVFIERMNLACQASKLLF